MRTNQLFVRSIWFDTTKTFPTEYKLGSKQRYKEERWQLLSNPHNSSSSHLVALGKQRHEEKFAIPS